MEPTSGSAAKLDHRKVPASFEVAHRETDLLTKSSGSSPHITINAKTPSFHCTASSGDISPRRSIKSTKRQTGKRSSGVRRASVLVMSSTQQI